ncbi:unnamed protein product [Sphenostylis stenocarpa]|uniref:Uncharacterized protein n=1 Tax=Sphenostylis stenocarpa TaxID=92480 RepID=A0AA86T338_9FABA|nr:unnamed protein product [Sphenostylis stenocarpa]
MSSVPKVESFNIVPSVMERKLGLSNMGSPLEQHGPSIRRKIGGETVAVVVRNSCNDYTVGVKGGEIDRKIRHVSSIGKFRCFSVLEYICGLLSVAEGLKLKRDDITRAKVQTTKFRD